MQDEDSNSGHEEYDEDQVIDLTTGMQETGEEDAELMGDNEITDLTGDSEAEDAGELMGSNDKIIDLTGEEEDTGN